jgi:hypothetical protein
MKNYEEIKIQAENILRTLRADGLSVSITHSMQLHIVGRAKSAQLHIIRLWKRHIVEALCPKCSNCNLPMQIIDNGKLWFCPFGCESQKREISLSLDNACNRTSLTSLTSQSPSNKAETCDVTRDVTKTDEMSNITNITKREQTANGKR